VQLKLNRMLSYILPFLKITIVSKRFGIKLLPECGTLIPQIFFKRNFTAIQHRKTTFKNISSI
jgi:hypothetical protein